MGILVLGTAVGRWGRQSAPVRLSRSRDNYTARALRRSRRFYRLSILAEATALWRRRLSCPFTRFLGLQRILWMELRYARPRTRRHGESPVGDWRRRFHGRLRGIASTAVKSPSPPSGFTMPPDAKSGLRRTRNFTKSTTRTLRHANGLRRTRKRRSADFTERARDVEFSRKRLSRTNGEGV